MKTVFAALGLVLLFIGLITVAFANVRYETWSPAKVIGTENDSWSVTANYSSGEGLCVYMTANQKWLQVYDLPLDPNSIFQYGELNLTLEVIDPYGNTTVFRYRWVRWPRGGSSSDYNLLPESSVIVQNGSLIYSESLIEECLYRPSGVVRYSGIYTVNITTMGDDPTVVSYQYPNNPPASIQLARLTTITTEPYSYALPYGVTSFIGGTAASIYGVKSKERKSKSQKK